MTAPPKFRARRSRSTSCLSLPALLHKRCSQERNGTAVPPSSDLEDQILGFPPKQCPPPATVQDPHSAHHHSALKATPSGRSRRQGRRRRPPELGFSPERQGRGAEEQMYTDVSKKNNGALERRRRRGRPGPTKGFPPIRISSTSFIRGQGPDNHRSEERRVGKEC